MNLYYHYKIYTNIKLYTYVWVPNGLKYNIDKKSTVVLYLN